jgi:hypothetical protein
MKQEQRQEQLLESGQMIEDADKLLNNMGRDTAPESCTLEFCWSEFI